MKWPMCERNQCDMRNIILKWPMLIIISMIRMRYNEEYNY